ncbi:MAG: AI-2E family transporter [Thermoanaerobaculia bacterium]
MQQERRTAPDEQSSSELERIPRFGTVAIVAYALLAGAVIYGSWRVLSPFMTPILLAAVIVMLTFEMFERLAAKLGERRNTAALLMLLFVTLALALPALLLVTLLVQEATSIFVKLQEANYQSFFDSFQLDERLATVKRIAPWLRIESIPIGDLVMNVVRQVPALVATQGGKVLAGFFNIFLGFIMMLLAAFVLYTYGNRISREVKLLSPLPDVYDEQIMLKFRGVIDATFRGQLLTGLAQGFVTGIGLAIAGVDGAILWGSAAAIASLVPMVGAAAIWIPATIYLGFLASQGSVGWWRPIFMLIWGVGVVSLVDNVIRPLVMRRGANLHPIVLLFAIFGGLQVFGFTGLFLGPLIIALLITVAEIYKTAFQFSIEQSNKGDRRGGSQRETPVPEPPPSSS